MKVLDNFSQWMEENKNLASSSIDKYKRAINTISNEMMAKGTITKPLMEMNPLELGISIELIFNDPDFVIKNTTGNNMYSAAIKGYRFFAFDDVDYHNAETRIEKEIAESSIPLTEKEEIIKARLGQGHFRKQLVEKYKGSCVITGIDCHGLLIASHIKPWAASTNSERVDVENGILLCANMDKLFDKGLITFDNSGRMYISSILNKANRHRLRIEEQVEFNLQQSKRMEEYLEYHRDILFVR